MTEPTEPILEPETPPPMPVRRRHRAALLLGLVLVVVVAATAAVLFWAPALTSLGAPAKTDEVAALSGRLDRLEAAQSQAAAANESALAELARHLHALEAKPPPPPPDLSGMTQQIATLTAMLGQLGSRIDGLDKTVRAQQAGDPTDAALALLALQIGEAVRVARPFAAEYQSFAALAQNRPEIIAAAAPLAAPAATGVASRAVLARELHALSATIATAAPPPAEADWSDRILAQLRGLVTVRRLDGVGQSPTEAALGAAEKAMAQGDLADAVAALQKLSGAPADAARPWLQMAAARLKVEEALRNLATLLATRLGAAAAAVQKPPG